MINKEQHVFSYNLGLIALMNGIIALSFASCNYQPFTRGIYPKLHSKPCCFLFAHTTWEIIPYSRYIWCKCFYILNKSLITLVNTGYCTRARGVFSVVSQTHKNTSLHLIFSSIAQKLV